MTTACCGLTFPLPCPHTCVTSDCSMLSPTHCLLRPKTGDYCLLWSNHSPALSSDLGHLRKQLEKVRQEQATGRDPLIAQLSGLVESFKQSSQQLQEQTLSAVRSETANQIKASLGRYEVTGVTAETDTGGAMRQAD